MAPERPDGPRPRPTWFESLVDAVGEDSVLVGDEAVGFAAPWRGGAGECAAVVLPRSEVEVVTLVEFARRQSARLIPQGANTGLVESGVPDDSGQMIVVSTNRLRGEIAIDPIGATATIAAGRRLSELNEAAASAGLRLPVDLSADPSIGGMVSTNAAGSYVLRYGPTRHQLLGLDVCVADPEPRICRWTAGLRKDARGPSPWQDFVGAQGQLGIVTRVCAAMTPLPTDTACVFLKFESLGRAMEALQTIRRNLGSALVAFELISSQALLVTTENAPNIQAPWDGSLGDESFTALVQAETFGDGSAEHSLVRSIAALIDAGLGPVDSAFVPVESAWALRHSISSALARAGHVLGLDIAVPVHRLAAARRRIRDFVTDRAPTAILADFGHAGDGGLHANVLFPHRTPPPDRAGLDELRLGLSKLVVREEGTFSAEHGIGPANAAIWQELATETDRRAWHALKARWDPAGIFGRPLGPDPLPEPAG